MLREFTSTKMVLYWTLMLKVFILFENVKGWNSSSDTVTVPDVIELQALDMWRLEVKWMVNQNEEQRNQTYEIQIGRTSNMDIVDRLNVSRGSLETVHTLVWTSQLPLNCVNHSVRVRLISGASPSSSWSSWKTIYGEMNLAHNEIKMFPDDQVLREGSTVMFCCIFPKETHITSMFFGNNPYKVINISPRVKAIQVENIKATNSFGVNFYCDNNIDETAFNFVTFPPEKPFDFKCETEDMRHAYCLWKIHRAPNLLGNQKRKYTLQISDSKSVSCDVEGTDPASCGFDVIPHQITYNITLFVTNSLGQESETYIFSITDRVFPVPKHLEVTAGVFDSLVILQLNGNFKGLLLICQTELEPGGIIQDLDKNGSDSMQSYAFRLQHLKPSTQYSVRGRCAVQGNDWGRWTTQRLFITEPLVTIDLWSQIRDHPNRTIILLWKTASSDSESYINAYEVCVSYRNTERSVCMNVTQTHVELMREINMSDITVRAVIQSGLSEPAHITIPSGHTDSMLREKRIMGNEKGFQLTWKRDSAATCGYTIEWCMLGIALPCSPEWRKVPDNQTFLNLTAGDFKAGVQYAFEIYGCSADGPRRHEKQIGYLKEQKPTQRPTLDSSPNITWSSVELKWSFNEKDPSHAGFITGYVITIQDYSEAGSDLSSFRVSVDDPHSKSWTVSGLEEDQLYTFQLAACTSAGCGPETTATFRTRQNYYLLLVKVLVPLLVSIGCCVCLWSYRNLIRGFPKETFSFLHIKALDLDEDLYEASEKIRTLMIEDCEWCDVEILDVQPIPAEKAWLTSVEDPNCSFISPKVTLPSCHLTTDVWLATNLTNFTYVSSVQQDVPSEELKTEATTQGSEIADFSSDYVTSVAT
ncbi:leukemia inhibitory factor receptor isoform X1 [Carassius gibelio]|uniref:leukemia inhibitory factor receptor isoform X1 n=2 Tax=Carassius gibelio TaxID=101364 RepID=UPI00227896A6|nr:leukemia inhibitory factor receptor isoform X1 [Carassius gibelio]